MEEPIKTDLVQVQRERLEQLMARNHELTEDMCLIMDSFAGIIQLLGITGNEKPTMFELMAKLPAVLKPENTDQMGKVFSSILTKYQPDYERYRQRQQNNTATNPGGNDRPAISRV